MDCRLLLLIFFLFHSTNLSAASLSFIGLRGDDWLIYHQALKKKAGEPVSISGIKNPRAFSRFPGRSMLAYIDDRGILQLFDEATRQTTTLQPASDENRYTQLHFDAGGALWAAQLPKGNSRQTNLVSIDLPSGVTHTVVAKRSAQFDPFWSEPYLYHSVAHCIDDCDPMIWELWRKDVRTGKQEQLTLGQAVSREPVILGEYLYFISNRDQFYHLWRMPPKVGAQPEQLTQGMITDTSLAPLTDEALYFIRRTQKGVSIMSFDPKSRLVEALPLPEWITDLRELEAYK